MRQIGSEKDDPLKRIQEEINEVARRERELREKMQQQQQPNQKSPIDGKKTINHDEEKDEASNCCEIVENDHEKCDEINSDDSGFSASSSPVNGTSTNSTTILNNNTKNNNTEKKYIRSNGFNLIPSTPPSFQQKSLTRAVSTPQIFQLSTMNTTTTITPGGRRFNINSSQKGIMQRFIATRGKIAAQHAANNQQQQQQHYQQQEKQQNNSSLSGILDNNHGPIYFSTTITPPIIERDSDGKPIRRGYVPVEEKIQKELKDIKTRETELKRIRKMKAMQSQPDLLDSIEDGEFNSDDDDSDVEHCFPPGKLRSSKSISELCDGINNSSSLSPRATPSPVFDRKSHNGSGGGGSLKPAISLAQLCDLDPEEAPSSHQLIAKWESLIQQNA